MRIHLIIKPQLAIPVIIGDLSTQTNFKTFHQGFRGLEVEF